MIRPFRDRPSDRAAVLFMAQAFYERTHYASMVPLNDDAIPGLIEAMHKNGVLLLAEHEGEVVGMVGLVLAPFMFNPTIAGAHEVMWYVEPNAQGAGIGRALLEAIEPACRKAGAGFIQMMCLHNSPPHAAQLYERLGYQPSEHSFTKVL